MELIWFCLKIISHKVKIIKFWKIKNVENEYKIIIILAIIASISIASSFILLSRNHVKIVEVYVSNLDNKSHSIHIRIFNENHVFVNRSINILPDKYTKFLFVSEGREDFIVMAETNGIFQQKRVKGWMITISIINIKNKTEIDIEGMK